MERCRLGHGFEQWCIAYAAEDKWKAVPAELHRLLQDTFSGWIQTRVNEKANKVWRDAEHRDNPSKIVAMCTLWEKLTAREVLGEFARAEVCTEEGNSDVPNVVSDFQLLFEDAKDKVATKLDAAESEIDKDALENAWLKKFDGVLKDTGKAFNPESEQVLVAELRLLRLLHEGNMWHRANDAWHTSLLPVGALIYVQSIDAHLWVLKTNDCAAMCWPAEQVELHMWRKGKVTELVWYTCFDLEDVQVLQFEVLSPQSLMLQDVFDCGLLVQTRAFLQIVTSHSSLNKGYKA